MNKLEAEARGWLEPYCHDNGFLADERNADTVAAFLTAFALEREQRWVRVEDVGLPRKKGEYWWTHENGELERFVYDPHELRPILTKRYIAWMPVQPDPEPYTEGE